MVGLRALGEIAGGGQPTTVGERTGKNSVPYALVYLAEESPCFFESGIENSMESGYIKLPLAGSI